MNRTYARVDAADDESCRPDFVLLLYPWKVISDDRSAPPWTLAPELAALSKDHPPAFISSNEDDPTAPPPNSLG